MIYWEGFGFGVGFLFGLFIAGWVIIHWIRLRLCSLFYNVLKEYPDVLDDAEMVKVMKELGISVESFKENDDER